MILKLVSLFIFALSFSVIVQSQESNFDYCDDATISMLENYVITIDVSDVNDSLVVSDTSGIKLYSADSLPEYIELMYEHIEFGGFGISFSSDGSQIASYISPTIGLVIWDYNKFTVSNVFLSGIRISNTSETFYSTTWSSDSEKIALAGSLGLEVWHIGTETLLYQSDIPSTNIQSYRDNLPSLIAWSPDDNYLAVGRQSEIIILQTETWDTYQVIPLASDTIQAIDLIGTP